MEALKEKNMEFRKNSNINRAAIRLPSFGGEDHFTTERLLNNALQNSNGNKERDTIISSSETPTFNRSSLDENVFEFNNG
jgi:hypothetical protein